MRLRTALTLFKTAYGFYSPPRFAGGKLVEEVLYRTLLILQNQLLPQVCFMQTCSGRNSFVAKNLHTVRPSAFPQQNDSGNNCPNSENHSLSTSLLMQTRAGGISVISCRIPFSATRNLPAKIRPCKSRPLSHCSPFSCSILSYGFLRFLQNAVDCVSRFNSMRFQHSIECCKVF